MIFNQSFLVSPLNSPRCGCIASVLYCGNLFQTKLRVPRSLGQLRKMLFDDTSSWETAHYLMNPNPWVCLNNGLL